VDAGGVEGADQERTAVAGEGEDLGDHAAVREDSGWFAGGVDEGLVEAALVVQLVDQGNEMGAGDRVPVRPPPNPAATTATNSSNTSAIPRSARLSRYLIEIAELWVPALSAPLMPLSVL
jgi:hypothetical protein